MSRDIRFIDSRYNNLFTVPDGGNVVVTQFDGEKLVRPCRFLDETHFEADHNVFHICQFAERMEENGTIYVPEIVKPGDCIDTYEIYQIENARGIDYCFRSYSEAAKQIDRDDYIRKYVGMLAPKTSMEFLFVKHNRDGRPFGSRMRSLSVSDVIVLNRAGKQQAFYVDNVGFQEIKEFYRSEREIALSQKASKKRNREFER